MNVSLTPELEAFVQQKVESGRYSSASEVVRESLRLLEKRDSRDREINEEIRRKVQEGIDELDRGEGILINGDAELREFMEDIKRRGRQRLREQMGLNEK